MKKLNSELCINKINEDPSFVDFLSGMLKIEPK
jgi:hypothetical protein